MVEHRGDRQSGSSVNRVAAAEAALAEARQAREQLTRQLRDAETALREAQTKRGHAELARDEALAALAAERIARETAEEQIRQLAAEARTPALEAPAASAPIARATRRQATAIHGADALPKRRGRPPGSLSKNRQQAAKQAETEPETDESGAVEWWVPGWQERT